MEIGIIFIILNIIITLSAAAYIIVDGVYVSFVNRYSVRISRLNELNKKFVFNPFVSFDQVHTYDNEVFYNSISPEDYLIYQLQFLSYKVKKQIQLMELNRQKYNEYIYAVKAINVSGKYDKDTKGYIVKLLNLYEEKIYKKHIQSATTEFYLTVKLSLSKINGEVYRRKSARFTAPQITELIVRLNNKNGTFYRDRGIWDAICRVERGKVSNKLRFAVYQRDGYRCRYCHRSQKQAYLEVDHIIPISKGGKSTMDNLQTLCHDCNVKKGDKII